MALDHRRLIRPEKKKIRSIFLRSTSLLCKILPTNLGACKPTFYTICMYTLHLRWNSSMRHCFYQADLGQKAVFYNTNLHSFNIQDDESTRGRLAKPLKKFLKSPILPFGSHFCSASWVSVWMNINRVTQQRIYYVYFLFNSLTRGILSTPASDVHWTTENNRHGN